MILNIDKMWKLGPWTRTHTTRICVDLFNVSVIGYPFLAPFARHSVHLSAFKCPFGKQMVNYGKKKTSNERNGKLGKK